MGRATSLAIAASLEAVAAARIDLVDADPYRLAVFVGSGETGLDVEEFFPAMSVAWEDDPTRDYRHLGGRPSRLIDPYFSLRTLSNAAAALLAIEFDVHGATGNFVQGGISAALALAAAMREVTDQRADAALVVGCDSLLNIVTYLAFDRAGCLSRLDPDRACRPFDANRDGFVLGEAAAALLLEGRTHATQRGARILADLLAVEASSGDGGSRALAAAVPQRSTPSFVIAFGDSTSSGDAAEARCLAEGFGASTPVTACTGATGYIGAATALVQCVIALRALDEGLVPPIAHPVRPDPAFAIDLVRGEVRKYKRHQRPTALCLSRNFSGQHAAILLAAPSRS
jgi:3-oxoacyl-[acyl-carrier-protein] synthase II